MSVQESLAVWPHIMCQQTGQSAVHACLSIVIIDMSSYIYAFWEIFENGAWEYAGEYIKDEEYAFALVPKNSAPDSWGKYNFSIYYETSGEKGFPADLSEVLKAFIANYWKEANRPSWMTVAEMKDFYNKDTCGRFAHFDFQSMERKYHKPDEAVRVVFWADQ
ncbi:MAG: hypothetical protein R3F53_00720 [Gammaproteobacteria bacterium]